LIFAVFLCPALLSSLQLYLNGSFLYKYLLFLFHYRGLLPFEVFEDGGRYLAFSETESFAIRLAVSKNPTTEL